MSKNTSLRNYYFVGLHILVSLLCVLCGKTSAQEFKTVHPGIEYAHVDHTIGSDPVRINLLRLDLRKVRVDVHHAFDRAIGVKPTSEIAKDNNAVAAINAGFFRLDKTDFAGDASGLLMVDGELLSESLNDRVNLVLINSRRSTDLLFGHFSTAVALRFDLRSAPIGISGINREAKPSDVILYTPHFGLAPRLRKASAELILSSCKSNHRPLDTYGFRCRNIELLKGVSNKPIPANGFVISIGTEATEALAELNRNFSSEEFKRAGRQGYIQFLLRDLNGSVLAVDESVDITNGVSQLIKSGKIDITWEQEKASKSFAEMRHPRTAVAKLKDGKSLMITVDGRQPGVSVGMTLQELAEYILSLGATDAMNLDGGGSTTMFLDGKVVNTPSDKEGERKVSDAIIVTLRKM